MLLSPQLYLALANTVLVAHVGVALFIVGALVLTLIGGLRHWHWVRNGWFRAVHLAAIAYVALEAWLGIVCPLTTLEMWLRRQAGQTVYDGDFIAFWLSKLLFYQAPPWVFIAAYTAFALLVMLSWVWVPPRWRKRAPA